MDTPMNRKTMAWSSAANSAMMPSANRMASLFEPHCVGIVASAQLGSREQHRALVLVGFEQNTFALTSMTTTAIARSPKYEMYHKKRTCCGTMVL